MLFELHAQLRYRCGARPPDGDSVKGNLDGSVEKLVWLVLNDVSGETSSSLSVFRVSVT